LVLVGLRSLLSAGVAVVDLWVKILLMEQGQEELMQKQHLQDCQLDLHCIIQLEQVEQDRRAVVLQVDLHGHVLEQTPNLL
jgi:hypothetical protein